MVNFTDGTAQKAVETNPSDWLKESRSSKSDEIRNTSSVMRRSNRKIQIICLLLASIACGFVVTSLIFWQFSPQTLPAKPVDQIAEDRQTKAEEDVSSPPIKSVSSELAEPPLVGEPAVVTEPPVVAEPVTVAEVKETPLPVILPKSRRFGHGYRISQVAKEGKTSHFVEFKTDDTNNFIRVMFIVEDKSSSVRAVGLIQLKNYVYDWEEINPKIITVTALNKGFELKPMEVARLLSVPLGLTEFADLLRSHEITFHVDRIRFQLNERQIEAMRDLASRLPDGPTQVGSFTISHEKDRNDLSENEFFTIRYGPVMGKFLGETRNRLKSLADEKLKQLKSATAELKDAILRDDADEVVNRKKRIAELQAALSKLIAIPSDPSLLNQFQMQIGEVGALPPFSFDILQVLDRDFGEILISSDDVETTLKVSGIDATKLLKDAPFEPETNYFVVAGTASYTTVKGRTKTVFKLHTFLPSMCFDESELKQIDDAIKDDQKVVLSDDEQQQLKRTRETREKQGREKAAMQDAESKRNRAKSYLDSAKTLIKKSSRSGESNKAIRRFLEKAVAEDPDSEFGQEAAKLLETIE